MRGRLSLFRTLTLPLLFLCLTGCNRQPPSVQPALDLADSRPPANQGQPVRRETRPQEKARGDNRPPDPEKTGQGHQYALLVGCTRYPHLTGRDLEGPANDVQLMRQLLSDDPYRFPPKNIAVLAEAQGTEEKRPTRKNIEREFQDLIHKVRPGDQVVILLSGHGCQQPEINPDPDNPSPDGQVQIFLPADVDRWEAGSRGVTNAIINHEFKKWTKDMLQKGAWVWFIADCCHSGRMVRSPMDTVRQVKPRDLGIPQAEIDLALKQGGKNQGTTRGGSQPGDFSLADRKGASQQLAVNYACLPNEVTVELPLPESGADSRPYGLLTFTLCQVLKQARSPLTYRDLTERIQDQYVHMGRSFSTPLVEGLGMDQVVLSNRPGPAISLSGEIKIKAGPREEKPGLQVRSLGPRFLLSRGKQQGWKVNGGLLHGLTSGSRLTAFPPAGQANAEQPLGEVEVVQARTFDSDVQPWGDDRNPKPKPEDLINGVRCGPASVNYGSLKVPLAIAPTTADGKPLDPSRRQRLVQVLKKMAAEPGALFRLVEGAGVVPRFYLRAESNGAWFLVPADEMVVERASGEERAPHRGFGPFSPEALESPLGGICRASNLLSLTTAPQTRALQGPGALKAEVKIVKLKDKSDPKGVEIPWRPGLALAEGDLIAFEIINPNHVAVDVSLLFLDSDFGITAGYPRPGQVTDNRVPPHRSARTPAALITPAAGLEQVVAIAVEGMGAPKDFSWLAQPSLPRARGNDPGSQEALDSPLGRIFQLALYGAGDSRGAPAEQVNRYSFLRLSWTVAKKGN